MLSVRKEGVCSALSLLLDLDLVVAVRCTMYVLVYCTCYTQLMSAVAYNQSEFVYPQHIPHDAPLSSPIFVQVHRSETRRAGSLQGLGSEVRE